MLKRILIGLVGTVVVVAGGFAGWYWRPWSEYSPAEMAAVGDPDRLVENFRSMDGIFPYRTIPAAPQPRTFPRADAPLAVTYPWQGGEKALEAWLAESATTGLMVLKDGAVVHEAYRLGETVEARHTSWSVAKSFVATLIAMDLKDGLIASLDDPAEKYAPAYKGSAFGETSIRDLLMMASGVAFNEVYADPGSDIRKLFFDTFIMGRDVDASVAKVTRGRPAGQAFEYVSPVSHVLSAVVRGIHGKPLADVMAARIWAPLGMEDSAYWSTDVQDGTEIGYCCLNATLRDYAKLGEFYRLDGVWGGTRLLPEGWVAMATRPQAPWQEPGAFTDERGGQSGLRGYAMHFWVPKDYDGEYFAAGVFGQYVWVDAKRGVVIARTAADMEWTARLGETIAAFRAIARTVAGG